jgi:uncharacterized protein Yka (UPF0111/DUF47 family)
MVAKKEMIKEIGQDEIILPEIIISALIANDRIKYFLALLQSAAQRAEHPNQKFNPLREERESSQEGDPRYDIVIGGTQKVSEGDYSIPLYNNIMLEIKYNLDAMILPLLIHGDENLVDFQERAHRLLEGIPTPTEVVPKSKIQSITAGIRDGPDSIHLLVMDIHRALNSLQANIAQEDIEGAKAYLLGEGDRELVASFMEGLNRTAPLKFEHPGLGTTATRTGDKLVIQNDVGETESHLMIVNITGMKVSIVQTDVHLPRVMFFQGLFESFGVNWEDTLSRLPEKETVEKSVYHLSRGHFEAKDREQLKDFLRFFASRIVFLIDWNRARKKLQIFLPRKEAIDALTWAAENEVGHRGFLKLGGDQLIFEALEMAPRLPLRYGEPLYQALGRQRALEFFKSALAKSSNDLQAQRPIRLIKDELKLELLNYFRPAPQELIALCIEHAKLTFEVSATLRGAIQSLVQGADRSQMEKDAGRSKAWEKDADNIVSRVRTLAKSIDVAVPFVELVVNADDATDFLEEAMFLVTLFPDTDPSPLFKELGKIADIATASCQEFIKSLYAAEHAYDRCAQNEMLRFLDPVDKVIELEERCDQAIRHAMAAILRDPSDLRSTILAFEVARNIEESTNSMMKAAYLLKENLFDSLGTFEVR